MTTRTIISKKKAAGIGDDFNRFFVALASLMCSDYLRQTLLRALMHVVIMHIINVC